MLQKKEQEEQALYTGLRNKVMPMINYKCAVSPACDQQGCEYNIFVILLIIRRAKTLSMSDKTAVKQVGIKSIYRDFRRVEINVVDSATWKVSPSRGQPLFDGLERNIEVNDCIHGVDVIQGLGLGYCSRETW